MARHQGIIVSEMSSFRSRPRFCQILEKSPEMLQDQILESINGSETDYEVLDFAGFLCLRIPENDRHFWSPRLNLSFDQTEEGKTQITGIYGPNANVWSIFLYSYLTLGSAALFSGVLSISQWAIDAKPWGLWIFAPATVGIVALYFIAQFGQKLGAQQTFQLHQTYETAVGEPVAIH